MEEVMAKIEVMLDDYVELYAQEACVLSAFHMNPEKRIRKLRNKLMNEHEAVRSKLLDHIEKLIKEGK